MKTIVSIQYLRAVAALSVAYRHIFENHNAADLSRYAFGVWGVDVFFVISGFVMWTTTSGSESNTILFWKNRVIRIYPIYWIALTLWIVGRLVIPDHLAGADISAPNIVLSALLVPHYHKVFIEHVWPILIPGWTLQFELFFYLTFGLMLLCASLVGRSILICGLLFCLAVAGSCLKPENALLVVYTNPMLLEFGAGVLLGCAYRNQFLLPPWLAGIAIVFGVAGVCFGESYASSDLMRLFVLGFPALLLVLGSVSLERQISRSPSALLLSLGNASYSIYLFHPFAIGILAISWWRWMPNGSESVFVMTALLASAVAGLIAHNFVESPLIRLLKKPRLSRVTT